MFGLPIRYLVCHNNSPNCMYCIRTAGRRIAVLPWLLDLGVHEELRGALALCAGIPDAAFETTPKTVPEKVANRSINGNNLVFDMDFRVLFPCIYSCPICDSFVVVCGRYKTSDLLPRSLWIELNFRWCSAQYFCVHKLSSKWFRRVRIAPVRHKRRDKLERKLCGLSDTSPFSFRSDMTRDSLPLRIWLTGRGIYVPYWEQSRLNSNRQSLLDQDLESEKAGDYTPKIKPARGFDLKQEDKLAIRSCQSTDDLWTIWMNFGDTWANFSD